MTQGTRCRVERFDRKLDRFTGAILVGEAKPNDATLHRVFGVNRRNQASPKDSRLPGKGVSRAHFDPLNGNVAIEGYKKPKHKRRIPQIHLGVQTLVLERKGIVTSRRQRWMEIEAERGERARELAARQVAARAQRQRAHMEALRGRIKPARREHRGEGVGRDDVAEDASPFDADTVESPPPAVEVSSKAGAPEDEMTHEELLAWEAEHCMSIDDLLEQALERDAANYRAQLEREAQEMHDRQEEVLQGLQKANPTLDVGRFQTMETVSGRYVDWDVKEGFGFVQTDGGELLTVEAPENHEAMRGRNVDVRFGESFVLEVTPRKLEQKPSQTAEDMTRLGEYKQFLANVSQETVVSLSRRPVFEGRMLGEHKVAGKTLVLVENEREILVTPRAPSLKARYNKDVVVYAERGSDGGLRARAHEKDRGMER